jgi:hypothetical protein
MRLAEGGQAGAVVNQQGTPMNIYQRLNEVRKAVSYIQKDKRIQGGGNYMAVTHDAVTSEVRDHLVKHGVVVSPSLVKSTTIDTGTTTSSGVPIIRYEAAYDIAFVNCDEPTDRHVMQLEAHALDNGDKAPGKAISYATKYAMLKLFSIETGEGEEERIPAKGKGKILAGTITPTTGAFDGLAPDRAEVVRRIGDAVIEMIDADRLKDAYTYLYVENKDAGRISNDEMIAVWSMLGPYSKARSEFKRMRDKHMKSEQSNNTTTTTEPEAA